MTKSNYTKNVLTLITGTGLAQAIPIAISPILTRLYSPEEFGLFGFYLALSAICAVGVTGRYELAIHLPKRDRDAVNIVALSILLSIILSLLILLIVFFFNSKITSLFNKPEISNWLYWVPASTLLMGIYQSFNYWSNRKSQYKRLAISRTVQSGAMATTQLSTGYMSLGNFGLVSGQLVGQMISSIILGKQIVQEDKKYLTQISKARIVAMAKKYKKFPQILIVSHVFNTASVQMPIMLFSVFFSGSIAGFYMLTQRVMGAPTSLIAGAIGDVFRQEASYAFIHTGSCRDIYIRTFKKLLILSSFPSLIFIFIAPDLFSFVFGDEWREAGLYAQILTPMFFLRFVTTPLSVMFMIAEKQKLDLMWQVGLFSMTSISLILGGFLESIAVGVFLFSTSYSIMFVLNGFMTFKMVSRCKN